MKTLSDKKPFFNKIQAIGLFRNLSAEAVRFLMEKADFLEFTDGEVIVVEGDLSPSFFGILEGTVVVGVSREGKDVYFNTLGPGEVFGEASLFANHPRTANVKAQERVAVIKMTRFELQEFLNLYPAEGNKLLLSVLFGIINKLKSANLELADERKNDYNQSEVDQLLAEFTGRKS